MSCSKEPQNCFEIAFIWPKRTHRWQMQTTKGKLNIICKYTTLQLCRTVGEKSIGFPCLFCCSHLESHSNYNNPHYTNCHVVVFLTKNANSHIPKNNMHFVEWTISWTTLHQDSWLASKAEPTPLWSIIYHSISFFRDKHLQSLKHTLLDIA